MPDRRSLLPVRTRSLRVTPPHPVRLRQLVLTALAAVLLTAAVSAAQPTAIQPTAHPSTANKTTQRPPQQTTRQTANADSIDGSSWWDGTYETGLSTTYLSGSGAREVHVHLARTIPLTVGPPRGALQSRLEIVPVRAGWRTGLDGRRRFRGRIALADADLYRAPIAIGLTLGEYDRTGRFEEESRWIDVRTGVSVRWSGNRLATEPRLMGSVGLTTIRPGVAAWELGPAAGNRTTGLDLGARAELPVRLEPIGFIAAGAGARTVQGSTDLGERWMSAELGIALTPGLEWRTHLQWGDLRGPTGSDMHLFARTGLHLRIR